MELYSPGSDVRLSKLIVWYFDSSAPTDSFNGEVCNFVYIFRVYWRFYETESQIKCWRLWRALRKEDIFSCSFHLHGFILSSVQYSLRPFRLSAIVFSYFKLSSHTYAAAQNGNESGIISKADKPSTRNWKGKVCCNVEEIPREYVLRAFP